MTLVADGEEIALPRDAEGVILLNINSYAGGVKMWERGPRFRLGEGASEGGWWEEWWRGLRGDGGGMVMGPDADGGEKDASAGGDVLPTTNNISPRQKQQQQQRHHGEFGDSAADDGRLDVVVVRGALHLGQLNLGVSTPARLCQAKRVTLKVRSITTLVPIRPRSRGARRSLRTFPVASLRPGSLAFNPDTPRRLSTPLLTPFNST